MPIHLRQVKLGHLSFGPHLVALNASPRGYVIAFNDRRMLIGERARLTLAIAAVLILHLLLLWGLIITPRVPVDLPDTDQSVVQAEIDQPPPEPAVQPVLPVQLVPRPVAKPEPQPQTQTVAQAASPPAPPVPAPQAPKPAPETAKAMPKVVNQPQETFETPRSPTLQARADVKLQATQAPDQSLDPESKTADVKLKKKQEEELQARQTLTASIPADMAGDIKLHEAPSPSVQTVVAPSGLTSDGTHLAVGAPPGAGVIGGGAQAGGHNGLKGGRGVLSQALQDDDFCLKAQRDGKPIPANSHMKSLTQMAALTAKLGPQLQKEADAHAFQQKYKNQPGNQAYWNRNTVNSRPGSQLGEGDDQAGAYTDSKDQRVMAGTDPDPKDSIHQTAH